jgi:hypothetical protein
MLPVLPLSPNAHPVTTLARVSLGYRQAAFRIFGDRVPLQLSIALDGLHQIHLDIEYRADQLTMLEWSKADCRKAAQVIQGLLLENTYLLSRRLPDEAFQGRLPVSTPEMDGRSSATPASSASAGSAVQTTESSVMSESSGSSETSVTHEAARPSDHQLRETQEQKKTRRQARWGPLLKEKGLSVNGWSKLAGVSRSAVYDWLNGLSELETTTAHSLAAALGVPASELN